MVRADAFRTSWHTLASGKGVWDHLHGPCGNRFGDFWPTGSLVLIWTLIVTVIVTPIIWPF